MTTITLPEIDLSSKDYIYNPDSFFKCYRQHAPVFYLEKYRCWLISRHADVKKALNDPAFSRNINYSNNINFNEVAKQWDREGIGFLADVIADENAGVRNRQLINNAFKAKKVDLMDELIDSVVAHYFQRLKKGGVIDLVDIIAPIPCALIRKILGIQLDGDEAEEKFRLSTISIVPGFFNPCATPELRQKAIDSTLYLRTLLLKEVANRKQNPQADLLTEFVQAIEGTSGCDEMDVVKLVLILILGASDTTVFTTLYAVKDLFEHPEQFALLKSNRDLMTNALKELLRFHTAGSLFPKYAVKDVVYHEQTIKKGDAVFIAIASANKDEQVFPQPDVLDITRNTDETLSFGYGRHHCLGMRLALTLMGNILNRFLDDLPANARLMSEAIQWEENSGRCTIVYLPLDTAL